MQIVLNQISPVAFSVLGFPVRWYALAYIIAFVVGYFFVRYLARRPDSGLNFDKRDFDDLLSWVILGVIIGGRLGYVLIYNFPYYLGHPLEIFAVWRGGMSFHGGLVGVIAAIFLFTKNLWRGLNFLDLVAVVAPIGLFFGRIANFINMELMGRVPNSDSAICVIFDGVSTECRHPSPLYEATTEGLILFIIMICLYKFTRLRTHPGALSGVFGMCYAGFRIFCEQFRAPDAQINFLMNGWLTMGQLLSGIMFIIGAGLFVFAIRRRP